jgi:hypothetical protein
MKKNFRTRGPLVGRMKEVPMEIVGSSDGGQKF